LALCSLLKSLHAQAWEERTPLALLPQPQRLCLTLLLLLLLPTLQNAEWSHHGSELQCLLSPRPLQTQDCGAQRIGVPAAY
jgi:hypothetical protein